MKKALCSVLAVLTIFCGIPAWVFAEEMPAESTTAVVAEESGVFDSRECTSDYQTQIGAEEAASESFAIEDESASPQEATPAEALDPADEALPVEPTQRVLTPDTVVCRVYLCATASSFTGHVWLYVINLTDFELPLGYVTLLPREEMSVGSLRNSRKDNGGTYYNGEAYMASHCKTTQRVMQHTTSLCTDITYAQLETMNRKICGHNSYLLLFNNCGDFACSVWNSVCPKGKRVINLLVPAPTILLMRLKGAQKGSLEMKQPDPSRCFKQIQNGARQANTASFNTSCV